MSPFAEAPDDGPVAVPIVADDVWERPEMLEWAFSSYEPPPLHPTDWESGLDSARWTPAELDRTY